MERSLRILDSARAVLDDTASGSVRRPRRSGRVLMDGREAGPLRPPLRARGDRAARDGGGGDRLGVLPVGALARRAGEGAERIDRRPRRVDARGERGEPAEGRSTSRCSRSGWTPTRATRPSSPPSTASAFAPSSSRRSRRGSRPSRGRTPSAPLSPFAMPQYKLAATANADRLEAKAAAFSQRVGRSSSGPTTTRWPSCCSPRRCSSRASARGCTRPRTRMVVLGLGYVLFLGSVIWVATFPVSAVPVGPRGYASRLNCQVAMPSIARPSRATIATSNRPGRCQPHQVTPGLRTWRAATLMSRCANTARRIGSTA